MINEPEANSYAEPEHWSARSNIRAIIFDCFGVIISDSLSVLCSELLSDKPDTVKRIWDLIERTNKGLMSPDDSSAQIAEMFGLSLDVYRQKLSAGEAKDQTLLDYIGQLRANYKTAMLSNVGIGSLARRFNVGELEKYFDVVIESAAIGHAKPEAAAYEIAAQRLAVEPTECIFIDDRQDYIEGAQVVGMATILYKDFAQTRQGIDRLLADSQ